MCLFYETSPPAAAPDQISGERLPQKFVGLDCRRGGRPEELLLLADRVVREARASLVGGVSDISHALAVLLFGLSEALGLDCWWEHAFAPITRYDYFYRLHVVGPLTKGGGLKVQACRYSKRAGGYQAIAEFLPFEAALERLGIGALAEQMAAASQAGDPITLPKRRYRPVSQDVLTPCPTCRRPACTRCLRVPTPGDVESLSVASV